MKTNNMLTFKQAGGLLKPTTDRSMSRELLLWIFSFRSFRIRHDWQNREKGLVYDSRFNLFCKWLCWIPVKCIIIGFTAFAMGSVKPYKNPYKGYKKVIKKGLLWDTTYYVQR